jgi:hypothetical protein
MDKRCANAYLENIGMGGTPRPAGRQAHANDNYDDVVVKVPRLL